MAFCTATTTSIQASIEPTIEPVRPFANFPPSIWGDRFLSFSLDNPQLEAYAKDMLEPKEELRRLIVEPTMDSNEKLSLIYSVYRLGLKYIYIEEIEGVLDKLFKELNLEEYKETDLYTISVNFQVFRLHGYRLSCDVFNKFKDYSSGRFKEYIKNDIKGLLSFYESTQLKIRGETILDEAMAFTEAQLKSVVDTLVGNLERQVKHALRSPFHRGLPMVEARLYFSNYEEECSTYDSISKLANTHFKYLQIIQKEELYVVSKWSKDIEFHIITPYARERIPELYLWALAICFEPNYSQGRIIITKIAQLITVLDDTYDAYATIEELRLLTDAINRWDFSAMDLLPPNVKGFYHVILNEYGEFEKQLSKEGRTNRVNTSKEAFQDLARGYLQEAEWRHEGHVPSFQEYLDNGLSTSTYKVFLTSCLMGMGKIVNEEDLGWYVSHPKVMKSLELIGRLYNDVTSYQFENERAQKQVTSVDAYMKNFAVPENVAIDELKKMIENGWEDINEGCLKPTHVSMELLAPILNLARMTDVSYRYIDKFTFPDKSVEEYITLLFGNAS